MFRGKMNVIFRKSGAALSPPACQRDPNGIKDRCFSCVVRADENRRVAKLYIKRALSSWAEICRSVESSR
jgi:hypothetical protein